MANEPITLEQKIFNLLIEDHTKSGALGDSLGKACIGLDWGYAVEWRGDQLVVSFTSDVYDFSDEVSKDWTQNIREFLVDHALHSPKNIALLREAADLAEARSVKHDPA